MRKKKIKAKSVNRKPRIEVVLTLSKYNFGQHTLDPTEGGTASFLESMVPFHTMAEMLVDHGVKLGTKIKVTMQAQK